MALIEGCRHELEVSVGILEMAAATEVVLARIQAKAQLPGFRPGKAPLSVIRSRFGSEIQQDALEEVIPKALDKRFAEDKLRVVGQPNISEVKMEPNQPLSFKVSFEVHPEFELGEYKGLEVEYEDPQVSEQDVSDRLEQLLESKAEYVNIDPRPAESGDYVVVGLESADGLEGEPMKNPEMTLLLGDADTMPAFSEGIAGMSPGETKDIAVSYPEDYGQDRLSGKTVTFDVELKFIRRKEVPLLDDDFAKSMGDFRTLDEFRRQLRIQLESYARSLQMQGIDPKQLNFDMNKFRESQTERAIRDVRATLLLDRISEVEAVSVGNDEVDREVHRLARQQREPVAAVRLKLEKDDGLDRIANRIRTDKTISLLFEQARKVAPVAPVVAEQTGTAEVES